MIISAPNTVDFVVTVIGIVNILRKTFVINYLLLLMFATVVPTGINVLLQREFIQLNLHKKIMKMF